MIIIKSNVQIVIEDLELVESKGKNIIHEEEKVQNGTYCFELK